MAFVKSMNFHFKIRFQVYTCIVSLQCSSFQCKNIPTFHYTLSNNTVQNIRISSKPNSNQRCFYNSSIIILKINRGFIYMCLQWGRMSKHEVKSDTIWFQIFQRFNHRATDSSMVQFQFQKQFLLKNNTDFLKSCIYIVDFFPKGIHCVKSQLKRTKIIELKVYMYNKGCSSKIKQCNNENAIMNY